MRHLALGILLISGCARLQDFTLNEGFAVSQALSTRCRATDDDERLSVQILGVGTAVCWESVFEEGLSTGRSCGAFQQRVADSDCTEPSIINSPNVVNLSFRLGRDADFASADFVRGTWWQCEEGELESKPFDGPAFFSLRNRPELALGNRDLHGVLRVTDCGDIDGRLVVDTDPPDTDIDIDTDIDTDTVVDTGGVDTGEFDTGG